METKKTKMQILRKKLKFIHTLNVNLNILSFFENFVMIMRKVVVTQQTLLRGIIPF